MLSSRQVELLLNSLVYAGGVAFLSLGLGLASGFLLARFKIFGGRVWRALLWLPLLISPYLHALAWRLLFLDLGIDTARYLYTLPTAVGITALAYFPIVSATTYFALQNIDASLEEAAWLVVSRLTTWRRITFPLIKPVVLTSVGVVFLLTLASFGVTSFLHINVYVYEIFTQFSAFFNFQSAYLLTLPLLLIAAFAVGMIFYFTRKPYFSLWGTGRKLEREKPGSVVSLGGVLFLLLLVSFSLLVPLVVFVKETGSWSNFWFALRGSGGVILNSLWLAALATLFAVGVSAVVSLGLKYRFIYQAVLGWLAVPSVTIGILLIKIFNRPLLDVVYQSFLIILIGYLVRFLPFTYAVVSYFKERVDPTLFEAAYLTGASNEQIFKKIKLPLWLPGILAGGLFFFLLALTELATTILVYPSGYQTLPIRIFALLHYGAPELVAALSLVMILLALGFTALGYVSYRHLSP